GGLDPTALLSEYRVRFVLLTPPAPSLGEDVTAPADGMTARAATSLDSNASLAHVGPTDRGTLWRFEGDIAQAGVGPRDPLASTLVLVSLALVFGFALLLAVPTAASRR